MADPVKNFARCTVSTGYDDAAVSVALTAGHGAKLPAPATDGAFNVVWYDSTNYARPDDDPNVEIVRVTARSTDTLTVTRAQEGTSGSTKNTGGATYVMILAPTAKTITDIYNGPTTEVTGTTQQMTSNARYIANNAALVTLTLPTTAAFGSIIEIAGKGAGLWKVAQNAGQTIHFGNIDTTTGAGGDVTATHRYDSLRLVCVTADTDFVAVSSQGVMSIT